jgi:hypothetical protein
MGGSSDLQAPVGSEHRDDEALIDMFVSAGDHAMFLLFPHGRRRYRPQN